MFCHNYLNDDFDIPTKKKDRKEILQFIYSFKTKGVYLCINEALKNLGYTNYLRLSSWEL